jgi:hypothetical protein
MKIDDITINQCVVHIVGNKGRNEGVNLSNNELFLDESEESELLEFFLKPFKNISEAHRFYHEIDLKMNEVFICSDNILENDDFIKNSQNIANHLFKQSKNPSIKQGELFITKLEGVNIEGTISRAIGIFKSERKDVFFNVNRFNENQIDLDMSLGINKGKLDKGCIIIGEDFKNGFKVYVYEYNGADTEYWRSDFLSITPRNDDYQQTKQFLNEYKHFITKELPKEIEMTRADQIDLVNRSVDFFKSNQEFNKSAFATQVLNDEDLISSFDKKMQESWEDQFDDFQISKSAVKKQTKIFKSVLKLDKNFHIYIHGNRNLIEHGFDADKGKRFYKVYFDEEL